MRIISYWIHERAVSATGHTAAGVNATLVGIHGTVGSISCAKVPCQGVSYSVRVGSKCSQPSKGDAELAIGGESILPMKRRLR